MPPPRLCSEDCAKMCVFRQRLSSCTLRWWFAGLRGCALCSGSSSSICPFSYLMASLRWVMILVHITTHQGRNVYISSEVNLNRMKRQSKSTTCSSILCKVVVVVKPAAGTGLDALAGSLRAIRMVVSVVCSGDRVLIVSAIVCRKVNPLTASELSKLKTPPPHITHNH